MLTKWLVVYSFIHKQSTINGYLSICLEISKADGLAMLGSLVMCTLYTNKFTFDLRLDENSEYGLGILLIEIHSLCFCCNHLVICIAIQHPNDSQRCPTWRVGEIMSGMALGRGSRDSIDSFTHVQKREQ